MNSLRQVRRKIFGGSFFRTLRLRLTNYNQFRKEADDLLPKKFYEENNKLLKDMEQIQKYQRKLALRDWYYMENKEIKENNENKTSSLYRDFSFSNAKEALNFMNIIKPKCDEMNHHPEWTLEDNKLSVKLTSHFQNNNVSNMDYELAVFMSQRYEDRSLDIFYDVPQFTYGTAVVISLLITSVIWFFMQIEKKYRITGRDFLFTKINFDTNDYNNERKLKNLKEK